MMFLFFIFMLGTHLQTYTFTEKELIVSSFNALTKSQKIFTDNEIDEKIAEVRSQALCNGLNQLNVLKKIQHKVEKLVAIHKATITYKFLKTLAMLFGLAVTTYLLWKYAYDRELLIKEKHISLCNNEFTNVCDMLKTKGTSVIGSLDSHFIEYRTEGDPWYRARWLDSIEEETIQLKRIAWKAHNIPTDLISEISKFIGAATFIASMGAFIESIKIKDHTMSNNYNYYLRIQKQIEEALKNIPDIHNER